MGLDKRPLLFGEECLRLRAVQDVEQPLVVDDLRGEGAGEEDVVVLCGGDEVRARVIVLHDVGRDGAAVDGVDFHSGGRPERVISVLEVTHIDDLTVHARSFEAAFELFKVSHGRVVEDVDDGDVGFFHMLRVRPVQPQERLDPAVKDFEGLEVVHCRNGPVRGVFSQCLAVLEVPDHGGGAVRVDLAELEVSGVLVVEEVEPGHRELAVVRDGQAHQLFKFLREREQLPVLRVGLVCGDDLFENAVGHSGDRLEPVDGLPVVHLRDVDGLVKDPVVVDRRGCEDVADLQRGRPVFFVVLVHLFTVFAADFFE